MGRIFLTKEDAVIFTGRDNKLIGLEVGAVNVFLDEYLMEGVEQSETNLSIIKLASIRILNYWNRNDPSLKEITDVDVTLKYDTTVNKTLMPIDVIEMLRKFKKVENSVEPSYGFSFL